MTILFLHLTQKNDPLHQVTGQIVPKQKGQAINLSFGTVSGEGSQRFLKSYVFKIGNLDNQGRLVSTYQPSILPTFRILILSLDNKQGQIIGLGGEIGEGVNSSHNSVQELLGAGFGVGGYDGV